MSKSSRFRPALMSIGLLAALSAGGTGLYLGLSGSGAADAQPITVQPPAGAPMSFADLIERVSPAVISVNTKTVTQTSDEMRTWMERYRGQPGFDDFMRRQGIDPDNPDTLPEREGRSQGSGFFVSRDGHIVTNNHVVRGATEITVVLKDGRELPAKLIGADPSTDLAVLKIDDAGQFPYVSFAEQPGLRVGDWVVAVGNPFGLGGTATAGIVSADGRDIGGQYTDFIQIDAPINRGNSGGPTFDLSGRVVGVNTAIFSPTGGSVGIGFAIPSNVAAPIIRQLVDNGRVSRGWLGVVIQDFNADMANSMSMEGVTGAIVAEVTAGSPAEKAGLKRGDIIHSVNGEKVESSRDLTRAVGALAAGSKNTFALTREGKKTTLTVTIGERPDDLDAALPQAPTPAPAPETTEGPLGATYSGLTPAARTRLGLSESESGVVIASLKPNSALGTAGLSVGDAILEINGKPVKTPEELASMVAEAEASGAKNVLMAVRTSGRTLFTAIPLEKD
jgi:serine protease Do